MSWHYLGELSFSSGKMYVSDPCYKKGTCMLDNPEKPLQLVYGVDPKFKYTALVLRSDDPMQLLLVQTHLVPHLSFAAQDDCPTRRQAINFLSSLGWKRAKNRIGIDSGQAGFWDSLCPLGESTYAQANKMYRQVCDITKESELEAGMYKDHGVVSRSFYGDRICEVYEYCADCNTDVYELWDDQHYLVGLRIDFEGSFHCPTVQDRAFTLGTGALCRHKTDLQLKLKIVKKKQRKGKKNEQLRGFINRLKDLDSFQDTEIQKIMEVVSDVRYDLERFLNTNYM